MALAPLGFVVDTSPVAKAVGDLERLTLATTKAEAATKTVSTGTNAAAASARQLGTATAAAATQMTIATNAVRANNAALLISNEQSRMAQQQMRNLAFQTQDVFTMLLSGQNPYMLLAQQLPQITMYGGRLNGVMGALKGTLASVFSPLGLLTTGFVLAGSAAISFFQDTGDEAEKAAEALEEQRDMIRRVADEWGAALPQVRAYADEVERAKKLREAGEVTRLTIDNEFEKAKKALEDFKAAFSDLLRTVNFGGTFIDASGGVADALSELDNASNAFFEELRRGNDTSDEFAKLQDEVADSLQLTSRMTGEQRSQVVALGSAYVQTAKDALAAAQAMERAASIDAARAANRGRFDRTGDRLGAVAPLSDMEFNSRFGWDEVFDFPKERTRRPRKSEAEREAERTKKAYEDMIRSSQQFIAAQELEQQALGMTEEAANALRYEQELLNQAANDSIALTPEMTAELKAYAEQMAEAEATTAQLREQTEFLKDTTYNAFMDAIPVIETGNRALDNLLNTLIEVVAQALLLGEGPLAGLFGGGGGLLSAIFGGLGGGSSDPWAGMRWAKGGAFQSGNVIPFARGGVVSRPTVFPMANGAGLMGEAGPEGILPLRRNAQGQLGVIASQANQNAAPMSITYAPVYQVAQGADPKAIAELRKAQAQDRAQFEGRVIKTIIEARRRNAKV